jgi:signal transduction histidine kinase/ligand-binding sensor domain-containing protein
VSAENKLALCERACHIAAVTWTALRVLLPVLLLSAACGQAQNAGLREPVHPRRNGEEFPATVTKRVRFTILETTRGEPCFDELELYGPDAPDENLALSSRGTVARVSGSLPGFRIHALEHLNDGSYGNGRSWIGDTPGSGWVELELPAPAAISRVVWSRDREGKFTDRLTLKYRIEAAGADGLWRQVASSDDRAPLDLMLGENPVFANSLRRIAPAATDLAGSDRAAAREYLLETWQTSRGLPSNTVTALLAARDGWLWIGTTNGVAVFDGVRFRVFGETGGLPALGVTCLLQDSHGSVWAGTQGGGAARWNGVRFEPLAVNTGTAANTVLALAEDAAGSIWAGTPGGLRELSGGSFVIRSTEPVPRMAVSGGGLWLISHSTLRKWNGSVLEPMPAQFDLSTFSSLSALTAGPDGALWFGGANGVLGRLAENVVSSFGEGDAVLASTAWELLAAGNGDVWVGTSGSGIGRLRAGKLLPLTTDDGLPANSVLALCEDREGNIWTGTSGGGLTRISPRRVQAVSTRDGLSHNAIMALAQDRDGTVWIGTNGGGLNRLSGDHPAPYVPSYVLENKSLASLLPAADGALWVGADSGLFRVQGGKLDYFSHLEGMSVRQVTALQEAPGGALWVGTLESGAVLFDGEKAAVPRGLEPLSGQPVTTILTDALGAQWFGTAGHGVARLAGETLTRWTRAGGLASDFVRTLRTDSTGAVWAGTSGGLTRWKDGTLYSFTAAHGLPDVFISQILDDTAGHLWLGTNKGVLRVALASLDAVAAGRASRLEVFALGTGDGLPSLECTGGYHPAGLRLQDGRLCFGTVAGLAIVDPQRFLTPGEAPPVVIEEVSAGSSAMSFEGSSPFTLPRDAGNLEIHFTALHFTAPERVRFRYRMKGLESLWNEAGSARSARYAHLPAGDFAFSVIASADGLTWSPPAEIKLTVPVAWWRSPQVVIPSILAALALVATAVRFFTRRRMQRRVRALEQQFALERERTRIARDIHDDLGANLTQIGLLSALGQQQRDPLVAAQHFQNIAGTATELVQSLDAIVWAVNPRHDTLESLARYLTRFAGDFCSQSGVRLRLDVPPQLPDAALSSELRHNVFLAAKEALHNALRHARAQELHLRITATAAQFTVSLADDGCGFTPGSAEEGDGLTNMRQRLADCGGTCEISTAAGRGTTIHFTLPLPASP